MIRHLRIIIFFLAALAAPCGTVYASDFLSSRSALERCPDIEKANKDLIKKLKKEHDASSVTVERWIDGKIYFIIKRKDGTWARAEMDGSLIWFTDQFGQKWAFLKKCEMNRHSTGDENYRVCLPQGPVWSIVWNNGRLYNTFDKASLCFKLNGCVYYKFDRHQQPNTYDIFRIDGKKINTSPAKFFKNVRGGQQYTLSVGRLNIDMPCPSGSDYLCFMETDATGKGNRKWQLWLDENRHYTFEGLILPGNLVRVGNVPNNSFMTTIRTRHHISCEGYPLQIDTVIVTRLEYSVPLYRLSDNILLADSINCVLTVKGTSIITYGIEDSDGHMSHVGMTDLSNPSLILPPVFDDIYTAPNGTILVRTDCSNPFATYDPNVEYTFSSRTTYNDTPGLISRIADDFGQQDNLALMINRDILYPCHPKRDGRLRWKADKISLNLNIYDIMGFYDRNIKKDGTMDAVINLYKRLINGYASIDSAYYVYLERKEARDLAFSEKIRLKRERKERLQKAYERCRQLDEFKSQISKAQAIVREGEKRIVSKNAVASQGKASDTSVSKEAMGTTSGTNSNTDRKAFLRSQIADWKNKLKKAENSYRQAVSSGEDTWEKERVIESKRKTVDECLEMIRQYEAELNSL